MRRLIPLSARDYLLSRYFNVGAMRHQNCTSHELLRTPLEAVPVQCWAGTAKRPTRDTTPWEVHHEAISVGGRDSPCGRDAADARHRLGTDQHWAALLRGASESVGLQL